MNRRHIPEVVFDKLAAFEKTVEHLTTRVAKTQDGIISARQRLTGGFARQSEFDDVTASLKQLVADKPMLEKKLHAAQSTLLNCKVWLDQLPEGTVLEPVEVNAKGLDLATVRQRIKVVEAELATLRAVPTPSVDIEARVRGYVEATARPTITGIQENEKLRVLWPGGGFDSSGPREHRADPLSLMALLHGDAMVTALMREVERTANDPLPPAARRKRIAKLEAEIDTLDRQELALGADARPLPPEVILGVKVARREPVKRAERRERAA